MERIKDTIYLNKVRAHLVSIGGSVDFKCWHASVIIYAYIIKLQDVLRLYNVDFIIKSAYCKCTDIKHGNLNTF